MRATFDRAAYLRHLSSEAWERKRRECFAYWRWKCSVCDLDWRDRPGGNLQCHHLPNGYDHLGREDARWHLRPLCDLHHPKGRFDLYQIKLARSAYRWRKRVAAAWRWLTGGRR
jgi:hypothetical protein